MKKVLRSSILIFILTISTAWSSDYLVIFETTSCNGESGFATVKVEDVYKIESADCMAPGKAGEKLKQVLVKSGSGSYDRFTLTQDEAKSVVSDMKMYMKAKLKSLENSNTLIITQ